MAQRDDALDKLEAFIAALVETQANFQQNADRVGKLEDAFGTQRAEAHEKIGRFGESVERFTKSFVAQHKEVLDGLEEMTESLGEIINARLGDAIKTVEDTQKTIEEASDGFQSGIEETFNYPLGGDTGILQLGYGSDVTPKVAALDALVDELAQKAKDAFDGLEETVEGLGKEAEAARSKALDSLELARTRTSEIEMEQVDEAFDELTRGLTAGGEALASGLDGVANLLTGAFGTFNEKTATIGENLMQMDKDYLTETLAHLKDELMQPLEDAFKEMVADGVPAFDADIIESIAMMTAGTAVISALAPYVPMLATAKKLIGTIKELLDKIDMA